jgi:hypothetical protein
VETVRRLWHLGWLAELGLGLAACRAGEEFPCDVDAQCIDDGIAGVCRSPGWCSFPDDTCPSGHRFGRHAGDGLARTCVPEEDTSSDGPSTTVASTLTDPTTGSLPDTSPVTPSEEGSLTGSGTTSSVDPDSSSTGASSIDPTGIESTTGERDPCPTTVDDFEDDVIGPQWIVDSPGYVSDADGMRVFEITAAADFYPSTFLVETQDLTNGWVRAHVGAHPMTFSEQMYLTVAPSGSSDERLQLFVEGFELMARHDTEGPGWAQLYEEPYDAQSQQWLQIRAEDGIVYFEVADEDMIFEPIAMIAVPFDLGDARVGLVAGNYDLLPAPVSLTWEHFEVCTAP